MCVCVRDTIIVGSLCPKHSPLGLYLTSLLSTPPGPGVLQAPAGVGDLCHDAPCSNPQHFSAAPHMPRIACVYVSHSNSSSHASRPLRGGGRCGSTRLESHGDVCNPYILACCVQHTFAPSRCSVHPVADTTSLPCTTYQPPVSALPRNPFPYSIVIRQVL